ncbi:MAG: hypothetical protein K6G62_05405 [Eubacterium sp.]|nr:hypothetical protein [Eubacterium sp.]
MRQVVRDLIRGKNVAEGLEAYKNLVLEAYGAYGALDLTFSAYTLVEEVEEGKGDKSLDKLLFALKDLAKEEADTEKILAQMVKLRQKITEKMDFFTAYTDRLICYEYVLNRMELKYLDPAEMDKRLECFDQKNFMQRLKFFLFSDKDQALIQEKIRMVMGQVPVRMTKAKFYDRLREALTLYKGAKKTALDDFLYILRTSAMIYEPAAGGEEYPEFFKDFNKLEEANYKDVSLAKFQELRACLDRASLWIYAITDYYYSMQKLVNGIYAQCLLRRHGLGQDELTKSCAAIWKSLAQGQYQEEFLRPLEGKIESWVEKTTYLESVFPEISQSYEKEIEDLDLVEDFRDLELLTKLLSDSLFIDLERVEDETELKNKDVNKACDLLIEDLDRKFKEVKKPVRRAIMGQVLEKLPMIFQGADQVMEYIETNLMDCQDQAEKMVVVDLIEGMME